MTERTAFSCPYHGYVIEPTNDDGCPVCIEAYTNGPDPATMTPDDRVAELERIVQMVTTAPRYFMPRVDALVGRQVWTHEIGLRWDDLVAEARAYTGEVPMDRVIGSLAATGKPVIVAVSDE